VQVRRTVRDLRRHNRSVLLSSLYLGEPQSRQDLGRSSGLSQGTVSNVVGELIEEGLVVEAGLVDSDGGRPRTLLRVNPGHTHVVGVDVGETGTRVEVFDLAMRPLATSYHPLPSARPEPAAVVAQIHEGLGEVLREAAVPTDDVLGIGVGVFGTVEQGR
jgi:DNA-binding transcriptional ArsR family regulator